MKTLIIVAILFIVGFGCQQQPPHLTDVQVVELEKQVRQQFDLLLKAADQLDADEYDRIHSVDHFIGKRANDELTSSRAQLMNMIKQGWGGLTKLELENNDPNKIVIRILSTDLALLDWSSKIHLVSKDGQASDLKLGMTLIFKKEASIWKIIYNHESVVANK